LLQGGKEIDLQIFKSTQLPGKIIRHERKNKMARNNRRNNRPVKRSYAKHFFMSWGYSIANATRLASESTPNMATANNSNVIRYVRLVNEGIV
jgi:hypothetical protein